jgi:phytoene dehydrogenase-like protein
MTTSSYDAVIVGSGPNGLAAGIVLARAGHSVCIVEGAETIGGGMRTAEKTLPGYRHDLCSAIHPMAVLSPFFRTLDLESHGLEWVHPRASVAHPLDGGRAAMLRRSFAETGATLGPDAERWERLIAPFLNNPDALLSDLMGPLGIPSQPITMARFGMLGLRSAVGLARGRFRGEEARAAFAGCAAHSLLPLDRAVTAAVGLVFAITAHLTDWPVARTGSQALADALAAEFRAQGGVIETDRPIETLADLPAHRVCLLDTSPHQVIAIAGDSLPAGYVHRLAKYRYGPAIYKINYALNEAIPWSAPECAEASTVHVGGTLEEIARAEKEAWEGVAPEKPFVLVGQQSLVDPTRAPEGKHTGYAYCHVPHACDVDMTAQLEAQIERFAPGFGDCIEARDVTTPQGFQAYNPNYLGGAVTGGAADLGQLFTRPVARWNPYTTPNPDLFLCSASTPPGGGVHGMNGFHAAQAALKRLQKDRRLALPPPRARGACT